MSEENKNGQTENSATQITSNGKQTSTGEDAKYWQSRYETLLSDYQRLQTLNQNLEEKLLNIAECFEKKRDELVANIEHEKSTLMADVNKLSSKLVDARIKLHDYEEKEQMHAAECNSACHKVCQTFKSPSVMTSQQTVNTCGYTNAKDQPYDPNLV